MPENNSKADSPELRQLQLPAQKSIRKTFRIAGPVILLIGTGCVTVAAAELFSGFGKFEPPRHIWLAFVGMPLMFVGSVLSMFGFMGAVLRYEAGEAAPVATDAVKYVAEETKGAVETVSKAVGKGVIQGIEAGRAESGRAKN